MKATVAKPIQTLRIEQGEYYTQIYLDSILLFSIHHVAKEFAANSEKLIGRGKYFITEEGIMSVLLKKRRKYYRHKTAAEACIRAIRDFRAGLCQLDL